MFFVPDVPSIMVDGAKLAAGEASAQFTSLEINGDHMKISCAKAGTITRSDKRLVINLLP